MKTFQVINTKSARTKNERETTYYTAKINKQLSNTVAGLSITRHLLVQLGSGIVARLGRRITLSDQQRAHHFSAKYITR